jgi:hypothetical protein
VAELFGTRTVGHVAELLVKTCDLRDVLVLSARMGPPQHSDVVDNFHEMGGSDEKKAETAKKIS